MSYDALKANYFLPQDMDYFSVQLEEMETLPLNETTGTWVTSVYNLWMESSSSFLLRARRTLTLKGTWLKRNNSNGEVSHYLSGTPVWLKTLQNQQKWKLTQKFILQKLCWYTEFNSQGDQDGNWLKLEKKNPYFSIDSFSWKNSFDILFVV